MVIFVLLITSFVGCAESSKDESQSENILVERQPDVGKLEVIISDNTYSYEGGVGGTSGSKGSGPRIDTASDPTWPVNNPRLDLMLQFGGFDKNIGIPDGTIIDFSKTSDISAYVWFIVATPQSGIVGEEPRYAYYEASVGECEGTLSINKYSYSKFNDYASGYETDITLENFILKKTESNETQQIWPSEIIIPFASFSSNKYIDK